MLVRSLFAAAALLTAAAAAGAESAHAHLTAAAPAANATYGWVLGVELLMVLGMLGLAARRRLRRHVLVEPALAAGVLASVALLGVLSPPAG